MEKIHPLKLAWLVVCIIFCNKDTNKAWDLSYLRRKRKRVIVAIRSIKSLEFVGDSSTN